MLTITFDGTLQIAPTVNGPWNDVNGESPLQITADDEAWFGRDRKYTPHEAKVKA